MIIEHVWEFSLDTITNVVDVSIKYLRHKVDQDFGKKLIHTMRGVGCQLGERREAECDGLSWRRYSLRACTIPPG
jgi:DNA-binding response OmpR family regulator